MNAAFNLLSRYLMLEIKWQLTKKKLNMRPQLLLNKALVVLAAEISLKT